MTAAQRLYPLIACASILFSVVAVVVGQFDPDPHLDPLAITISEYAVADRGGVTEVAMAVLGIGSVALLAGLRAAGAPVRGVPAWLLGVWSGALVVAAAIPTTPIGADLDAAAQVHRYVSVAAFVSLPAAGALLVSRLGADGRWKPVARVVEWVALAGGFGLLAITYVALPGDRVMIGLVERLLLGAEVALLAVLAGWLAWLVWGAAAVRVAGRVSGARAVTRGRNFLTYHRFIASRS
ncbi:DUF998 domain-containing protein [Nonomuraea phyllanthi]|uniref:DUF998 domain-containing protein n=1 Tax=Nonomuraea phyllanthi TaxID=2219224 RepID=A0A5C4VW36_9ACTN|nr:DUF998 domain-containing protein [Nonomuraea phyllanthi]KAB8190253.1 DUF998 domain-containing protein [Nonomuraea phyllanthi]QFY05496.1 DUF998 domain-containing protein [Nonomuraea phyllanthi]